MKGCAEGIVFAFALMLIWLSEPPAIAWQDANALLAKGILKNDFALVRQALQSGASPNLILPGDKKPALIAAIEKDNPLIVNALLVAGAKVNAPAVYFDEQRQSYVLRYPLYVAIFSNKPNPHIIKLLLQKGANPNLHMFLDPLLIQALEIGPPKITAQIVLLLLQHGANPRLLSGRGTSVMDALFTNIYLQLRRGGNVHDLDAYCCQICRMLVQRGVSVNMTGDLGFKPIFIAIYYNLIETTKYLVSAGAHLNEKDTFLHNPSLPHHTPLWWAQYFNETDIVRFLKQHGAIAE